MKAALFPQIMFYIGFAFMLIMAYRHYKKADKANREYAKYVKRRLDLDDRELALSINTKDVAQKLEYLSRPQSLDENVIIQLAHTVNALRLIDKFGVIDKSIFQGFDHTLQSAEEVLVRHPMCPSWFKNSVKHG
jgi:hypothetical protein